MSKKVIVDKVRRATIEGAGVDGEDIAITQWPDGDGFDIDCGDHVILRISNDQWKALRKGIKALKGKKGKKVKEEEDLANGQEYEQSAPEGADKNKRGENG